MGSWGSRQSFFRRGWIKACLNKGGTKPDTAVIYNGEDGGTNFFEHVLKKKCGDNV